MYWEGKYQNRNILECMLYYYCLFVFYQKSLSNSATALQAELNTALECERETEDEVKKLKVTRE